VLQQVPTAFTPHTKDGLNDVFMKNHHVIIFDRYGQKVFEGNDGWPGTHKGHQADPAVYFYELEMGNGLIVRGTIEVVKMH
jgi:gliding motility-associated-like protein